MGSTMNDVMQLQNFGLTMYEASVYLTLTRLGIGTPREIARLSGIRREEVYRTLPRLERLGLVDRLLDRPVKFRALPLKEGLMMLVRHREEEAMREISELNRQMNTLISQHSSSDSPASLTEEQPHFMLVSDRDPLNTRVRSMISKAQFRIDISDSYKNIVRFVLDHEDVLREATRRRVAIRIIMDYPSNDMALDTIQRHVPAQYVSMRFLDEPPSPYILFDNKEVMMATSLSDISPERKFLWSDDPNFVQLIQKNFDDLVTKSSDIHSCTCSLSNQLDRLLRSLRPRDHLILVYDSIDVKHSILFRFVEHALNKGEAVRYVCSEESPEQIREAMQRHGIDVTCHENSGALSIINYTEIYLKNGQFDLENVISAWSHIYQQVIAAGFSGLSVCGESAHFLRDNMLNKLIEYEQQLHPIFETPMIAICAYNSQHLTSIESSVDIYSELVKMHSRLLYGGTGSSGRVEIRTAFSH